VGAGAGGALGGGAGDGLVAIMPMCRGGARVCRRGLGEGQKFAHKSSYQVRFGTINQWFGYTKDVGYQQDTTPAAGPMGDTLP